MATKKREWSREFTPRGTRVVNLNVSGIPPTLRERFRAKCRRVGKSQRNVILSWVRNWVDGRRPDEDRPTPALHAPTDPDVIGVENPQQSV